MRTVKTVAQLSRLKGEPEPSKNEPEKPDPMAGLAQEIRDASFKSEKLIARSIDELHGAIEKFAKSPVDINLVETAKVRSWKFTHRYDDEGKIVSTTAEAKE